jgi:hypothetical protein
MFALAFWAGTWALAPQSRQEAQKQMGPEKGPFVYNSLLHVPGGDGGRQITIYMYPSISFKPLKRKRNS